MCWNAFEDSSNIAYCPWLFLIRNQRIATLENKLQAAQLEIEWAHLKIQVLEERLRQRRIQLLGPFSETLSDLQLELLVDEEPSATAEEVEAEQAENSSRQAGT